MIRFFIAILAIMLIQQHSFATEAEIVFKEDLAQKGWGGRLINRRNKNQFIRVYCSHEVTQFFKCEKLAPFLINKLDDGTIERTQLAPYLGNKDFFKSISQTRSDLNKVFKKRYAMSRSDELEKDLRGNFFVSEFEGGMALFVTQIIDLIALPFDGVHNIKAKRIRRKLDGFLTSINFKQDGYKAKVNGRSFKTIVETVESSL